ncbi:acetyltransferase [Dioszegia hungarica]|uniref:Acetyltransferase n=1 Tax=Dioszegia hungarica TaxID=4972 RepID=A0AA38H6W4_9TREE|nr:acetyltransferase [Dioszegia hungarica]KAI9633739.1 acetyltransferase [Dioszegia hungarica]
MAAATTSRATFATQGTVSNPLDLAPQGEHVSVDLAVGKSQRKTVRPKVKVTLTSLTTNNAGTLRKLNSVVLPLVYSDKFYKEILDATLDDVNKLIYYADIPVGAICCRFESLTSTAKEKPPTLVILTLSVLAPYRSLSLGTALLRNALTACLHPATPAPPIPSADKANTRGSLTVAAPRKVVKRAIAHVQVGNDSAKRFYERMGFRETETIKNFYSKMQPSGAVLMVCDDIAAALGETANGTA